MRSWLWDTAPLDPFSPAATRALSGGWTACTCNHLQIFQLLSSCNLCKAMDRLGWQGIGGTFEQDCSIALFSCTA